MARSSLTRIHLRAAILERQAAFGDKANCRANTAVNALCASVRPMSEQDQIPTRDRRAILLGAGLVGSVGVAGAGLVAGAPARPAGSVVQSIQRRPFRPAGLGRPDRRRGRAGCRAFRRPEIAGQGGLCQRLRLVVPDLPRGTSRLDGIRPLRRENLWRGFARRSRKDARLPARTRQPVRQGRRGSQGLSAPRAGRARHSGAFRVRAGAETGPMRRKARWISRNCASASRRSLPA